MEDLKIIAGDCRTTLAQVPAGSVQCCVTSPPYWGLRDYGHPDQIGQEKSPELYVATIVAVMREVWRVLKPDGTLWLNLGDSYIGSDKGRGDLKPTDKQSSNRGTLELTKRISKLPVPAGMKAKDLAGVPWLVAFALRADGWWLRSDIIWAKRNCMPESVTDRPTRSHEYLFLLSKSSKYFYDAEAIKEPCLYDVDGTGTAARKARAAGNKLAPTDKVNGIRASGPASQAGGFKDAALMNGKHQRDAGLAPKKQRGHGRRHDGFNDRWDAMEKEEQCTGMRNKRDVWTVAPANYPEAHFATYPPNLIKPCILAGSRPGDTVLDPFGGSGTTGAVALELGRRAIICELNPGYISLIEKRCDVTRGLAI